MKKILLMIISAISLSLTGCLDSDGEVSSGASTGGGTTGGSVAAGAVTPGTFGAGVILPAANVGAGVLPANVGVTLASLPADLDGAGCAAVGHMLAWTGSAWDCVAPAAASSVAAGSVTPGTFVAGVILPAANVGAGALPANVDVTLASLPADLDGAGCNANEILEWTGTAWDCVDHVAVTVQPVADPTTLPAPVAGDIAFNSTSGELEYFDGTAWVSTATSSGGDNMGDHTATQDLDMDSNNIIGAATVEAQSVCDDDLDTCVHMEKAADEDYVRIDTRGAERITVEPLGDVGIGITNPIAAFDLRSQRLQTAVFSNDAPADPFGTRVLLTHGGNSHGFVVGSGGLATWVDKFRITPSLSTYSHSANSTQGITVDGIGQVGIGDTSPSAALDVNGDIIADNFITASDRNFKDDIKALKNSLDKISQLSGYEYIWNEKAGDRQGERAIGVIAQEVEKQFPSLVHTQNLNQSDEYKSVDYQGLVAPMINAIKELHAENKDLKSRLEKLEAKMFN